MKASSAKIKRSATLLIPGTACNLNCSYCYRKGQGVQDRSIPAKFNYPVEHMLKALSKKRLGGPTVFIICGGGETMLPKEAVPLVKGLLKEGHVVDLITNLTLSDRVAELLDAPKEDLERLVIKASFHYLELKNLNKLDDYFNNFKKVIAAGASGSPILTISEEYRPLLDEIKEAWQKNINDLGHCTAALDNFNTTLSTRSFYTPEFVEIVKNKFGSKIFETYDKLLS
ncbi:MAG: radical SAM protein, partial [Elusimicrobiota bacterium]|nr:radical SAM protein [Elusimicrobiota bacterium]